MNLQVDIQSATEEPVPDEEDIRGWVQATLTAARPGADLCFEISMRLVDESEMAELNGNYRGKTGSTNVLSFPADLPPELDLGLLGDIAICAPVVRREASEQGKTERAHWAHMTVHGTLHLLGYDHIDDHEAAEMEALESSILGQLNYPCPYEERTAP